jgi:hypothetical protein
MRAQPSSSADTKKNKVENFAQSDNFAFRQMFFQFIESWLLPCSLRSHRTANSTPQNGLRHFSALPTHHPTSGWHRVKKDFAQQCVDSTTV